MKKLYFLDEEEKNRILSIHESATKRQYLSEQNQFSQMTTLDNMKGDANWEGKYSCVPIQGVRPSKLSDGSTIYLINGVTYYNNGIKKMADGKMLNYACETEFIKEGERQTNISKVYCSVKNGMITTGSLKNSPWNDYVKSFKITSQEIETAKKSCPKTKQNSGNRQQVVTKTTDTTKQIQKLLELPETGVMDSALLQKINDKLNGNSQSRPKVEPIQQLTTAGVTTPQLTTMSQEQLTSGLQKAAASTAGLKR